MLLAAASFLHVLEEYLLDWCGWVAATSGLHMSWRDFWIVNAAFLAFACAAAGLGWKSPAVSLALPALTTINALAFHIGPTLVLGSLSPGTITSVLLYVPLAAWIYRRARVEGVLSGRVVALSSALGAMLMSMPFPISVLLRR